MSSADAVTAELMAIIAVLHGGERALARERFAQLWARIEGRDAFHECVLCHYMADAQDDPAEELRWDRRALDAAMVARRTERAGEVALERPFGVTLASFFPSLHLNLAADLDALGERELARAHVLEARASLDGLADTDLARLTRHAIDRLARRLGEGD